jgi:hypothetical protein
LEELEEYSIDLLLILQKSEISDPLAPTASKQVFQKTEISDPLAPTAAK